MIQNPFNIIDLLQSILCYLPLDHIARFAHISKAFYSISKSPSFHPTRIRFVIGQNDATFESKDTPRHNYNRVLTGNYFVEDVKYTKA